MSSGIVVGAAGGIGAAVTRALDGSADLLVLAGRRQAPLEEVASDVSARTAVVSADIATEAGRDAIVAAVEQPIRWIVLASGLPLRKPLVELPEDQITAVFEANLVGPTLLLRRLLHLEWEPPAAITVIGSISASRSLPNRAVYGATKAGLEHLARSLAAELAQSGIRVNTVAPGVIATPFLGDGAPALADWVSQRVPVGRTGASEEVANVVRYITLDAPDYLTGARIAVDGGAEALG
jgi:NAD(P)-dependent dehydrogenase (short-subunit alcohol dehydrogenase family)